MSADEEGSAKENERDGGEQDEVEGFGSPPGSSISKESMGVFNDKYRKLILQYKAQIIQNARNPIGIAKQLRDQEIIDDSDLEYIESLSLLKWQKEVLFKFLLRSRINELERVKTALAKTRTETIRLQQIFQTISERGANSLQAFSFKYLDPKLGGDSASDSRRQSRRLSLRAFRSSKRSGDKPSAFCVPMAAMTMAPSKPEVEEGLLPKLNEAAQDGNVEHLVEVFAQVTSLEEVGTWVDHERRGRTPLHVAVMEGDSNKEFVKKFIELLAILCDSANEGNLRRRKDIEKNGSFLDIRQLEDFLSIQDKKGNTALHLAAECQAVEIAKCLYNHKASFMIVNREGVTALELMYEMIPGAVTYILDDHIRDVGPIQENSQLDLDMRPVIGCQRPGLSTDGSNSDSCSRNGGYVETQLLANIVLGNFDNCSKLIIRHVMVQLFLDRKWNQLLGRIFIFTMIYIFIHLLHTVFLIQVFVVSSPYEMRTNQSSRMTSDQLNHTNSNEDADERSQRLSSQFYNYLLGYSETGEFPDMLIQNVTHDPWTQNLAIASLVAGIYMLALESFEIWVTAASITSKAHARRKKASGEEPRRKIWIAFIVLFCTIYTRASEAVLSALFLLSLCTYDWIVKTSNSRNLNNMALTATNRSKNEKNRQQLNCISFSDGILHLIRIILMILIVLFVNPNFIMPTMTTFTISGFTSVLSILLILYECSAVFLWAAKIIRRGYRTLNRSLQKKISTDDDHLHLHQMSMSTPRTSEYGEDGDSIREALTLRTIDKVDAGFENISGSRRLGHQFCYRFLTACGGTFRQLWEFLVQFINGFFVYLENLENALQLVYITIIIAVSWFVAKGQLSRSLYIGAAFSVVLAWILILMQIGNIYGLGKYIQMLRTVIKSFLGIMGIYGSLLVAFSISFTILFPGEERFESLPSSFFRVVSMMTGEINYDEIFHPDDDDQVDNQAVRTPPFSSASKWMHLAFIIAVVIILINLLIGLTVSDIQKIQEKSDVIHRSVQVERLYVMEKLLAWFFCCCPTSGYCSSFVVGETEKRKYGCLLTKGSYRTFYSKGLHYQDLNRKFYSANSTLAICLNGLEPKLQKELLNLSSSGGSSGGGGQSSKTSDAKMSSKLISHILALYKGNKDDIQNFPFHWIPALVHDKRLQSRIKSISYKEPLTANECNARLLGILVSLCSSPSAGSSVEAMRLHSISISLRRKHRREYARWMEWSDCSSKFSTILKLNRESLEKLEINIKPLAFRTFLFPNRVLSIMGEQFCRLKFLKLRDGNGGFLSTHDLEKIAAASPNLHTLNVGEDWSWLESLSWVWKIWPGLQQLFLIIEVNKDGKGLGQPCLDEIFTGIPTDKTTVSLRQNFLGEDLHHFRTSPGISVMTKLRRLEVKFFSKNELTPEQQRSELFSQAPNAVWFTQMTGVYGFRLLPKPQFQAVFGFPVTSKCKDGIRAMLEPLRPFVTFEFDSS